MIRFCNSGAARWGRVLALGLAFAVSAAAGEPQSVTAIVGTTVVDPAGGRLPDATVILRGERIEKLGPRRSLKVPAGATVIMAEGTFLVPGLIDAHVHFFQSGGLYTRPDAFDFRDIVPYAVDQKEIREHLDETFARYLRSGVTSVADVGGPFWNFEVREKAAASTRAPRVAITGPLISSVSRDALDTGDPPIIRCVTPEEARALVRREAERKPDYIKIWYVQTPQETVEKNRPMVRAAIEESHRLGLRVAVHATQLATARAAIEEGADILVHSVDDALLDPAFIRLAKRRNIVYIPTLVVGEGYRRTRTQQFNFLPEELAWGDPNALGSLFDVMHLRGSPFAEKLRTGLANAKPITADPIMAGNLRAMRDAGVTVAMGTDAGNIGTLHGPSVFREMAAMEAAGLTPLEVLRTATMGGARVMVHGQELGRVAPGYLADLLLLDADPALTTQNLSHIRTVIRGGLALDPATLAPDGPEALAQRQLNAYNARDLDAFAAPYAEDVVIYDLDGKVVLRGKVAFKDHYRALFNAPNKAHCELVKRMVLGNWVVDEESITGAKPDSIRGVAIYKIKDGKIAEVRFLR